MTRVIKIYARAAHAGLAAVLALLLLASPGWAADPIFPTGSRIGIVPPPGMQTSKMFSGFEDPDKDVVILLATMPAAAYAEMDKTAVPDTLQKQGITMEKREPIKLSAGSGFLVVGRQGTDKLRNRKWLLVVAADDLTALVSVQVPEQNDTYTDSVVRAALATLSVRATVPDDEQLSLVPFKIGDLAGFHIEEVIPGHAVVLIDAPKDAHKDALDTSLDTRLLITAMQGGPAEPGDRANFARFAFAEIGGIKEVQITMSEPLRMNGQSGYQTMAKAKNTRTDTDIMVAQWLRFGSGGFLQMVGIARADAWFDALTRLRAVRDSVDPR